MNKLINRIALAKLLLKLAAVSTDKGELTYEGDLAVGTEVYVQNGDEIAPAEDGEYVAEDGQTLVIADGKIAEIKEAEQPAEEEAPAETEEPVQEEEAPAETEEPTEEPAETNDEVEELKRQLEEKDAKIAELEAKVAELEGKNAEQEEALKMSTEKSAKEVAKENKQNMGFKSYIRK